MKTIYIDISTLLIFPYTTGIQRVVSEVVVRLIANQKDGDYQVVLLRHDRDYSFSICDNDKFMAYYMLSWEEKNSCVTSKGINIDQLASSSFWLDLDGVWVSKIPRNLLYPQLAKRNIQIGAYVYDVIVLSHPQYASPENYIRFPAYLGAVFDYADLIFTEAEYTKKQIQQLAQEIGSNREIQYEIATPGGNFAKSIKKEAKIPDTVLKIVQKGKILLTVSTLEARKNHKVLLDAFDAGLCDMGYQMVFVGKVGWKIEDMIERIETHSENGKSLYHLQGLNDDTLTFLYKNADFILFPSYIEGYGLATVEAMQYEVPCILSDIPIMREVGRDYCDYFDPNKPGQLIDIIRSYELNPEKYKGKKEQLKDYQAPTWDKCAESIINKILQSRKSTEREHKVEQIVYLSARAENLLKTLKYVEEFMPFIRKALILCPHFMVAEMKELYQGNLDITCITDDELLQGRPLPKDHASRNFLLRCLAMSRPELDDEFIMSDDDYRPLEQIDLSFFIKNNRYQIFYFYDLDLWINNVMKPTSYDLLMIRTNDFLKENNLPNLQYASHMPQIIRKEWYLDLLEKYPALKSTSCDEWATYFNYIVKKYPEFIDVRPYVTMSWPETISSWTPMIIPQEFVFENFYEFLYDKEKPFAGMSTVFNDKTYLENAKKKLISRSQLEKSDAICRQWEAFENTYNAEFNHFPSFVFCYGKDLEPAFINPPAYLEMLNESVYSIPVMIIKKDEDGIWGRFNDGIRIGFSWYERGSIVEAENVNGCGQAVGRIRTPANVTATYLRLYYSFDNENFTFGCQIAVNFIKKDVKISSEQ